jgi:hypothetical protein
MRKFDSRLAVGLLCLAGAPALAGTEAAPAQVLVATDGHRVVFDEASASGERAIALYDAGGKLVRSVALGDFLPRDYVQVLAHDAGGLHWRGDAAVAAADSAQFSVAVPGPGAEALHFSIDWRDGRVRTSEIRQYLAAADTARRLAPAVAYR